MTDGYEYDELLDVTGTKVVNGEVKAGATVRAGGSLDVRGLFAGPLVVEEDAVVKVLGSFVGEIERNDGVVMLYGQVDIDLRDAVGRLVIGVDSLLTSDPGPARLCPDGSLEPVSGTLPAGSFNISTDLVCVYDVATGAFMPLGRLKS